MVRAGCAQGRRRTVTGALLPWAPPKQRGGQRRARIGAVERPRRLLTVRAAGALQEAQPIRVLGLAGLDRFAGLPRGRSGAPHAHPVPGGIFELRRVARRRPGPRPRHGEHRPVAVAPIDCTGSARPDPRGSQQSSRRTNTRPAGRVAGRGLGCASEAARVACRVHADRRDPVVSCGLVDGDAAHRDAEHRDRRATVCRPVETA